MKDYRNKIFYSLNRMKPDDKLIKKFYENALNGADMQNEPTDSSADEDYVCESEDGEIILVGEKKRIFFKFLSRFQRKTQIRTTQVQQATRMIKIQVIL